MRASADAPLASRVHPLPSAISLGGKAPLKKPAFNFPHFAQTELPADVVLLEPKLERILRRVYDLLPPRGLTMGDMREAVRDNHPQLRAVFAHYSKLFALGEVRLHTAMKKFRIVIVGFDCRSCRYLTLCRGVLDVSIIQYPFSLTKCCKILISRFATFASQHSTPRPPEDVSSMDVTFWHN